MILLDSARLGELSFDETHHGAGNGWHSALSKKPFWAGFLWEQGAMKTKPADWRVGDLISFYYWFISIAGGMGGCHCCWAL